jgi:hypothetical protein
LKEAARFAADAGAMQIQLREVEGWRQPREMRERRAPHRERRRGAENFHVPRKCNVGKREKEICRTGRHKQR